MRLDLELQRRSLTESRTEAQELIEKGLVFVDGALCTKRTKEVSETTEIKVIGKRKFVSRGGEKLEGALKDVFGGDVAIGKFCEKKKALDIGSSTGGFTDCLLSYGIESVDSVDVGKGQLHALLRENPKVRSYEKTDIRNFKSGILYGIIVADLSFISLSLIFESILSFGKKGTHYFLLIKPQFEVGKGNTKKGVVKDEKLVKKILEDYKNLCIKRGLEGVTIHESAIRGGGGNQEYFLHFMQ